MRFDKYKAFPYPVLRPGSDDYIDVEFQATVDFKVEGSIITASISYALSLEEVKVQIAKGNAEYVCVISSRDTYQQTLVATTSAKSEATFDVGALRGEVRVDPYVIVKQPIEGFTSTSINSEFGEGPFSFAVGDILAQDETQVFFIDRDVFRSVTSVFDLVKRDNLSDGEWKLDFSEEHIQIEVSPRMKESIDDARNETRNKVILKNSIYFAAVMQAVQNLKDSDDDVGNRKWAEVIRRQAHNKGIELQNDDAYWITEQLMQLPILQLDNLVFKGGRQ